MNCSANEVRRVYLMYKITVYEKKYFDFHCLFTPWRFFRCNGIRTINNCHSSTFLTYRICSVGKYCKQYDIGKKTTSDNHLPSNQ